VTRRCSTSNAVAGVDDVPVLEDARSPRALDLSDHRHADDGHGVDEELGDVISRIR
jgi:hypothetical protein